MRVREMVCGIDRQRAMKTAQRLREVRHQVRCGPVGDARVIVGVTQAVPCLRDERVASRWIDEVAIRLDRLVELTRCGHAVSKTARGKSQYQMMMAGDEALLARR